MVMTDANASIITKIDDDVLKYDSMGSGRDWEQHLKQEQLLRNCLLFTRNQ
jgi:hypothetical protein